MKTAIKRAMTIVLVVFAVVVGMVAATTTTTTTMMMMMMMDKENRKEKGVLVEEPVEVPNGWQLHEEHVDGGEEKLLPVFVALRRRNFDAVAKAFRESSDPAHERYGMHMTHAEIEEAVRLPEEQLRMVKKWLLDAGAKNIDFHRHGDSVQAVVTKKGAEMLCGTTLRKYLHKASGETAIVAADGVRVPEHLANIVVMVGGFSNFPLLLGGPAVKSKTEIGDPEGVTPPLIRKTYNVTLPPSSGKRNIQAIAQFQGSFYIESDVAALCTRYGLGKCEVARLVGDNSGGSDCFESDLDTEYTTSAVAGTNIGRTSVSCCECQRHGKQSTGRSYYSQVRSRFSFQHCHRSTGSTVAALVAALALSLALALALALV